jgi:hypothetical protein
MGYLDAKPLSDIVSGTETPHKEFLFLFLGSGIHSKKPYYHQASNTANDTLWKTHFLSTVEKFQNPQNSWKIP